MTDLVALSAFSTAVVANGLLTWWIYKRNIDSISHSDRYVSVDYKLCSKKRIYYNVGDIITRNYVGTTGFRTRVYNWDDMYYSSYEKMKAYIFRRTIKWPFIFMLPLFWLSLAIHGCIESIWYDYKRAKWGTKSPKPPLFR